MPTPKKGALLGGVLFDPPALAGMEPLAEGIVLTVALLADVVRNVAGPDVNVTALIRVGVIRGAAQHRRAIV